ncbi:hypothetical protein [Tunturiibacter gelidoferens]|uniref:Uncharacterized protein n=1 Tax=Tunturiibacter lichenicola TaxID=2051959 RepID=A0A7Y9NND5_9BACT|nr:hypothetical protein [Edaphobacter lichenicola]NYF52352.1 hypothetical protein [Edaphobacter lichenicola]
MKSKLKADAPSIKDIKTDLPSRVLELVKPLLITVGTATLGYIGVLLTPARPLLTHLFYHEDARVILSSDVNRVNVGQEIHVRGYIVPSGSLPVSGGQFEISYDRNLVRLASGQPLFITPQIDAPIQVPQSDGWTFVAVNPGIAEFHGVLTNPYGTFPKSTANSSSSLLTSEVKTEILPNDADPHATRDNFSGKWKIRLGDVDGTMTLKQLGDKVWSPIPGTYELEDGSHGSVNEGYHDGHDFGGQLINGGSVTKWSLVDLPFSITDDGFIIIQGQATLLKADSSGWKKVATKPFTATIGLH